MRKNLAALMIGASFVGCLDDNVDDNEAPVDPSLYEFSIGIVETNACGLDTPITDFEVIEFDETGEAVNRYSPGLSGSVNFITEDATQDLAVVETVDENYRITLLVDAAVQDYGNWYRRASTVEGCQCDSYDVTVQPGNSTTEHLNLDYGIVSSSVDAANYQGVTACYPEGGVEPVFVAFAEDDEAGINYFVSEAMSELADDDGHIDVTPSEPGRFITIENDEQLSHRFDYLSDAYNEFSLGFHGLNDAELLDHSRVQAKRYSATNQFTSYGIYKLWTVDVPLDQSTETISYDEPFSDFEQLETLLEGTRQTYDFASEDNQDMLMYYKGYVDSDSWTIVMPPSGLFRFIYKLPDDYPDRDEYEGMQYLEEFITFNLADNSANVASNVLLTNPDHLRLILKRQRVDDDFDTVLEQTYLYQFE